MTEDLTPTRAAVLVAHMAGPQPVKSMDRQAVAALVGGGLLCYDGFKTPPLSIITEHGRQAAARWLAGEAVG